MTDPIDHDQLFKTVIRTFFPEFLHLFFPDRAARYDLSAVTWLDKEVFADPPDGPRHILDMVAELAAVGRSDPASALALIHVEVESADSVTDLERRLPAYYFHLRRTHGKRVLPIVLYLKVGLEGVGVRVISDPPDDDAVMTFRYRYVALPGLTAGEEYLNGGDWLGVALSVLMGAATDDRLRIGVTAVRRIADSPLSDAKKALLGDCIETYIELPEPELVRFREIINANATGRVQPVNKTRVQLAEEQGMEKGRILAMRAAVLELLEARFGDIPADIADLVNVSAELDTLRRWHRAAATAPNLTAFRTAIGI